MGFEGLGARICIRVGSAWCCLAQARHGLIILTVQLDSLPNIPRACTPPRIVFGFYLPFFFSTNKSGCSEDFVRQHCMRRTICEAMPRCWPTVDLRSIRIAGSLRV